MQTQVGFIWLMAYFSRSLLINGGVYLDMMNVKLHADCVFLIQSGSFFANDNNQLHTLYNLAFGLRYASWY
jgi:hypothetical protein